MRIRVISQDFPGEWMPEEVEGDSNAKPPDIDSTGIDPELMPEFYARVGRILGHIRAFQINWWSGDFAITIEKGRTTSDGLICIYEDGLDEKLKTIETLASELAGFEAEHFLVIFEVQNSVIFKGERLVNTTH